MQVFFSHYFSLKNMFLQVDYNGVSYTWICFLPEKYTPLCKLTKMLFSTLKNIFYLRNIHLCGSVLQFFFIEDFLWASPLNWCLLHLKLFSTRRIYTFCAIWLKCLFQHIEMSSIQRIYTSVRVFQISYWRIFTSVRVD